jgi:hypothetical protein
MLFLNGVPLFFLELAIGQWFSSGVIGVWKSICPVFKGQLFFVVVCVNPQILDSVHQ